MGTPTIRDNWDSCYYDIQATITSKGNTVTLRPSQIISLLIERDYDNDHLPVIIISLSLHNDAPSINSETTINLRIDKMIGEVDGGVIRVASKSQYINEIFNFIPLENTPSSSKLEQILYSKLEKNEGDYLYQDGASSQTYILARREDYIASKKIMNCVITKTNLTSAIMLLLTNAGCKNVLMSNLDNVEEYEELLILPLPLLECLDFLRNQYGFHKEDTLVFMDFGIFYIIRKDGICSTFTGREGTNVDICLNGYESAYDQCRGVIYAGDTTYINVASDHFKRNVGGTLNDQTEGTNVLLYNENEVTSDIVETKNDAPLGGVRSTSIKSVKGHNRFSGTILTCRKAENQSIFTIGCSHADISVFTPNKQFSIISNCTEIAMDTMGTYRLSRNVTTFAKEGNYFIPITELTLKKTTPVEMPPMKEQPTLF